MPNLRGLPVSLLPVVPFFAASLLWAGCTILQGQGRQQTESMLATSGFKMKLADTPEKLAELKTKPQRKLTPMKRQGKLYFGYADAEGCSCAYLGDEAAYQKYQGLVVDNRLVEETVEPEPVVMPGTVVVVEDDGVWDSWGGGMW